MTAAGAVSFTAACPTCKSDAQWSVTDGNLVPRISCPVCQPPRPAGHVPAVDAAAAPSWAWIRTLSLVLTRMLVTAERSHTR